VKFRPCVPGCFAPATAADHALGMPRLGYTGTRDPEGRLRRRWEYWICPGICPDTRHTSRYARP